MYLKAYAKINLAINVLRKRKDGYHDLDMIMIPLKLHDTIAVSRLSKKASNRVLINDAPTNFLNDICGNIIKKMSETYSIKKKYEFAIYKDIPMEAGLGGGSSDAAAIFRFYNKKFKLKINDSDAIKIVKEFGKDIPFFLLNKPARVRGDGDIIDPIEIKNDYYALIVKPKQGLSTKDVYEALTKEDYHASDIDNVIKALKEGDDNLLAESIGNALESPAIKKCPKVNEIKQYLIANGFPITFMTGSGTAVCSLSLDKDLVEQTANNLKKLNYNAFYTKILKE